MLSVALFWSQSPFCMFPQNGEMNSDNDAVCCSPDCKQSKTNTACSAALLLLLGLPASDPNTHRLLTQQTLFCSVLSDIETETAYLYWVSLSSTQLFIFRNV